MVNTDKRAHSFGTRVRPLLAAALGAAVVWIAPPAVAQSCEPVCVDIGSTTDAVEDVTAGVSDVLQGEITTTVDGGPLDEVTGGNVGKVIDPITGTVKDAVDTVEETVNSLTGNQGENRPRGRDGGNRPEPPTEHPRRPDPGRNRGADPAGSAPTGGRIAPRDVVAADDPTAAVERPLEVDPGGLARLGEIAGEVTKKLAFPLALTLLVAAFLVVQSRIDGGDPKLTLAPVDSSGDYLSFQ